MPPPASLPLVWSNRDRRTLLDKMLALLRIAAVDHPFYFVADAYYATHKIVAGLLKQDNHLITRMKSNAVAYTPYRHRGPRKPGRPRVYGKKLKLRTLLQDPKAFQKAPSPVYGENKVTIQYRVRDLLWRPAGRMVRFVVVVHPTRGSCMLMCTDTSLDAIDIIRLMWTAPVVKRFLAPEFKFPSSSGEASERMLEKGDCARIMRSYIVEHPAKRRLALLGSNPPRNSRCKLNVMRMGRCA
jgi:hypothetical protein